MPVRSAPGHYIWFWLEGTPPINSTIVNTTTQLEGRTFLKGFQINRTGNYKFTIHADNEEGSDSKAIEVTVLGKVIKTVIKGLKACLQWKVHVAYAASLQALHSNT